MSKPSEDELLMALDHAKYLRESGQDEHCLAKVVLNYNYQIGYLLNVLHCVERYLQSGMSETLHSHLIKAIEEARRIDDYSSHREHQDLGLF